MCRRAVVYTRIRPNCRRIFREANIYPPNGDQPNGGFWLIRSVEYVLCKLRPNLQVTVWFLRVQLRWLPFVVIGLGVAMGNRIVDLIIPCVIGHIVFYVLYVLPVVLRRPVLKVPGWMERLCEGL